MSIMDQHGPIGALLRGIVLSLLLLVVGELVLRTTAEADGAGGANIGAGILAFLVVAGAALLWGWRDGRHGISLAHALLVWILAGVVVGVAAAFLAQLRGPDGLDWSVWWSDVLTMVPFYGLLVAVPALLGAALGGRLSPPGG